MSLALACGLQTVGFLTSGSTEVWLRSREMKPSDSSSPPLLTSLLPLLSRPHILAKLKAIALIFKSLSLFAAAMLFWSKWRLIIIDAISFKVVEVGKTFCLQNILPSRPGRHGGVENCM